MGANSVAEELLNQHPRIHERERYQRQMGKGYSLGGGKGSWRRPFRGEKAYFGDFNEDEPWDSHYSSVAGHTEDYGDDEWHEFEGYSSVTREDYEESNDGFMEEHVGLLLTDGFVLENDEAGALAAESLQHEWEAFLLKRQAQGKGHKGFSVQRHFDVKGKLSLAKRKARLQQLKKSNTECRKCGQKGHWSGDPQCPKSQGKGGKGTGRSSASSISGKGKKGDKGQKPRVVYFAMHQDNMAMRHSGAPSTGPPTASELLVRGLTSDQALEVLLREEQCTSAATSSSFNTRTLRNLKLELLDGESGRASETLKELQNMEVEEEQASWEHVSTIELQHEPGHALLRETPLYEMPARPQLYSQSPAIPAACAHSRIGKRARTAIGSKRLVLIASRS